VNEPGLPGENSNAQAPEIHCGAVIRKSSTTCEHHLDGVMISIVSSSAWPWDHEFELW
jgi:hypothetical protein